MIRKDLLRNRLRNPRTKLDTLRELIDCEERAGNKIAEAAYRIRFVRLTQIDAYDDLIKACRLLDQGQMRGAAVFTARLIVSAEFKCSEQARAASQEYLNDVHSEKSVKINYSASIDTRAKKKYRMSCILSLYNEEELVEKCFKRLTMQTLYRKGELEIIFVDSNSLQNEKDIFVRLLENYQHVLYIKTDETERLSQAWNRGIRHSTGEYLTFTAPSNFFVDDAFERLVKPFGDDPEIVLVQGDIGRPFDFYPEDLSPLKSEDLVRITKRKAEYLAQIHPFFFGNYLAFDAAVFKRSALEKTGLFDEAMVCAAENKFLLKLLSCGKVHQLDEVVESSYEQGGPRLTVHPRVEIEHFMSMHESFNEKYLLNAAQFDDVLRFGSQTEVLEHLLAISLGYVDPYNFSWPRPRYYDLEHGLKIAHLALEGSPDSFAAWNNLAVLSLHNTVAQSLRYLDFSKSRAEKKLFTFAVNKLTMLVLKRLVQWTYVVTTKSIRLRQQNPSRARFRQVRGIVNRIKLLFNRNRTFDPDLNGDTIW